MENRLKVIRAEKKLTQEKLAQLSGVSRVTISNLEKLKIEPSGYTMLRLSDALGLPIEKIFFLKCNTYNP